MSEETAVVETGERAPEITMDQIKAAMPPVLVTLMEIHKGELVHEMTKGLRDVVGAVRELGKGGKLTVSMNINPHDTGTVRAVDINWDITVKKPKPKQRPSCAFVTGTNDLSRRDPAQREFAGSGFDDE
jgi:hypothetical protein